MNRYKKTQRKGIIYDQHIFSVRTALKKNKQCPITGPDQADVIVFINLIWYRLNDEIVWSALYSTALSFYWNVQGLLYNLLFPDSNSVI